MVRALNAIENGERPGTYTEETMAMYARAYEVTEESVYAVLEGRADKLEPVPPAAEVSYARGSLPAPPQSQLLREDAVRPYADPIWELLLDLRDRGVHDPSGAQLGFPPGDAAVWDDSAGTMPLSDRVWLVGTIRRNRDARAAARTNGASTA